jgi:hypothetical protein
MTPAIYIYIYVYIYVYIIPKKYLYIEEKNCNGHVFSSFKNQRKSCKEKL